MSDNNKSLWREIQQNKKNIQKRPWIYPTK